MDALRGEMLWYDDAPSNVAEDILRKVHRPTILPAPISDSRDLRRFECHLKGNGVGKYFSVAEIVRPNRPDVAAASGWEDLTPPAFCWGLSTLLICLADRMREAAGSPVTLRNYWRPQSYNSMVSSSGIDSDHPNAAGIDLDFKSIQARQAALSWLCDFINATENSARVSVGLGAQTLHVGVLSPLGSRYWTYDSWSGAVPETLVRMAEMPFLRVYA